MLEENISFQGEANIPTIHTTFRMRAYSAKKEEPMPHLALVNPDTNLNDVVNVRIHSECMTGDVFGSCRCECGEQLQKSMEYIAKNGGVLVYLRQEGRGIGLINKLHAYVKQDEGFDTAEANKVLGFDFDSRNYDIAIYILKDLNIQKVNLLTNNPLKVKAFDKSDIEVVKRIPLLIEPKKENIDYLKTKKDFFGHFLT